MDMEYHEGHLSPEAREMHRALKSLREELEAVDWYQQRFDVSEDDELRAILAHNEDEELEHAAMLLEWLRRRAPGLDEKLQTILFSTGRPGELALSEEEEPASVESGRGDLGIGSLR